MAKHISKWLITKILWNSQVFLADKLDKSCISRAKTCFRQTVSRCYSSVKHLVLKHPAEKHVSTIHLTRIFAGSCWATAKSKKKNSWIEAIKCNCININTAGLKMALGAREKVDAGKAGEKLELLQGRLESSLWNDRLRKQKTDLIN